MTLLVASFFQTVALAMLGPTDMGCVKISPPMGDKTTSQKLVMIRNGKQRQYRVRS